MDVKLWNAAGILMAIVAVCVASSCGGGSPASPSAPPGGSAAASVSILMFPPSGGVLTTGYSKQVVATAKLTSGEYLTCTEFAKWVTSDPAVATVSPQGVMTGISPGPVAITATCFGAAGTLSTRVYQSVTLSGTIRDELGAPLANASVWARDSKFGHSTRTGSDGSYRIDGLPGGMRLPVSVNLDGYESTEADVTLEDNVTLDFTLRQGFSVGGRTSEPVLGQLGGVKVEAISGTNAGASTVSTSWGAYTLQHLLPGTFTLRASKAGYDSVERTITATGRTSVDFELKPSYGACLVLVSPLLFERFPSAGDDATVAVVANPGRAWTAVPSVEWIQVMSGAAATGSGNVVLRVRPMPAGAGDPREGTVRIGCSATEGQTVRVTQVPNCQVTLAWAPDSPTIFPATGGSGRVLVRAGNANCEWQVSSRDDWIIPVGVSRRSGDGESVFIIRENTTGAKRVGTLVVGEMEWKVEQQG